MRLSEKLLLLLSRRPGTSDYAAGHDHWTVQNALDRLCLNVPGFREMIREKDILDYGCGEGYQSVAMAKYGAQRVLGVEINGAYREQAWRLAAENGVQDQTRFVNNCDEAGKGRFDLVISHNSMEHFHDPEIALREMAAALKPDGKLVISFDPPWFAPYGSHMHFFTRVPWVNVLFRERTVMSVRRCFINDGATRYEEVGGGLNRMSVAKFERVVAASGMQIVYRRYTCVKRLNFLAIVPGIRELFVNQVYAILTGEAVRC